MGLGRRSRELMAACSLEGLVRWLNNDFEKHYESTVKSGLAFMLIDYTPISVFFNLS